MRIMRAKICIYEKKIVPLQQICCEACFRSERKLKLTLYETNLFSFGNSMWSLVLHGL